MEDTRRLMEDHHDHDYHHDDHDHHHHDHEDDHSFHLHSENTMEALADVQRSLRGSSMRLGKRRRLQGGSYSYQVDIYVEIDQQLCIDTGDDCANNGGTPGAIVTNYGKSKLWM